MTVGRSSRETFAARYRAIKPHWSPNYTASPPCATAARIHPMMKTTLSATRRTSSAVLMAKSTKLTLLVPDAAGYFSTATRTPDGRCGVR